MANLPQCTHPLIRDGRSQDDRRLADLDPHSPNFVKVDDRSLEQILEFIYEYARQVNYFDKQLSKKDWLAFFQDSVPFQIARIVRLDLNQWQKEYKVVFATFQKEPDFPAFNPVLDFLFDLIDQINTWQGKLAKDTSGLIGFINNLIGSNLSSALAELIAIANAAQVWGYRSTYDLLKFKQGAWGLDFQDILAVDKSFASSAIGCQQASESTDPKGRFRIPEGQTIGKEQGLNLGKSKLDELFAIFLEAMGQIQKEAKVKLRSSIDNYQAHEPHLGLFFAFLEVFGLARNDLNKMTKRHLDFYYHKVLRLKEREAILDKAHLVFEISPLEEKYLLEAGTKFSGGEDDSGVEMHFELEEQIVVDNAQIESLRTIYLDQVPVENAGEDKRYQVKGIFVAPVANSADGQGEAFPDENNRSWETVGEKISKSVDEEKTTRRDDPQYKLHPNANLGLLLGSKALYLNEGQRSVTLRLTCDKPGLEALVDQFMHFEEAVKTQFALTDQTRAALEENGFDFYFLPGLVNRWKIGLNQYRNDIVEPHADWLSSPQRDLLVKYAERRNVFDVYLTVDGEWLPVSQVRIFTEAVDSTRFNLVLEIELDENQPSIIAFDPEAHGLELDLAVPALKLEFNHDFVASGPIGGQGLSLYQYFRFLQVLDVNFAVDVKNVRDLILQNVDGVFGADAPFLPFGAEPQVGENFYIGSQEIFQKNLTSLNLSLTWGSLPEEPFWQHYLGYAAFPQLGDYDDFNTEQELHDLVLKTQIRPGDFSFDLKLLKDRTWQNFTVPSRFELFDYQLKDGTQVEKPFAEKTFEFELSPSPITGADFPEDIEELDVASKAGFIRLSLKPQHFGHDDFPELLTQHLNAQGLWAAEVAAAEAAAVVTVQNGGTAPDPKDLTPAFRVPDVGYLRIQEMIALLRMATLDLRSWLRHLEFLYEEQKDNIEHAIDLIDLPDSSQLRNQISGFENAVVEAKEEIEAFLAILMDDQFGPNQTTDSLIDKVFKNPNDLNEDVKFIVFLKNYIERIEERLNEERILNENLYPLTQKLEEIGAGKDALHYINLSVIAVSAIIEEVENKSIIALESLRSITGLVLLFSTTNFKDDSYHTHFIPTPKEPYTPEIINLSIDYQAETTSNQIAFFHLHPFEGTFQKYTVGTGNDKPELLPRFIDEGTLFLGIRDLRPGSNLHLLFQMAESTADPFTEQAEVNWSFLANNRWQSLEDKFDVLSDETNGLIKSGVIKLAVPNTITNTNTILPPELFWFKAAVPDRARAISETIAIHTQAARVKFIDRENDLSRLAKPLASNSIAEAVATFDEIQAVHQFYDSFGGRPKEKDIAYYTRVSERLRHKGRAITLFDFERLVLENFPQIYKVKCITHTLGRMAGADEDDHLAPGFVTIAVIPNLQNIQFADRFEPRATVALLKEIEKLIRKKSTPFMRLRVLNPDYELVNFSGNIGFVEGIDENFFKDKLRQDVEQFLAPWAFDPVAPIGFGGRIFRSNVLKFIEERSYVEFVTEFAMFGEDKKNVSDMATPSARSILIPGRMNFVAIECCTPSNA